MATEHTSSVRSNIWKLYAIQAFTQALFAIPIIFLIWQSRGLDLQHIMMLQAGFALTILVLEIPTGYLADRWGRKKTLITGCCFGVMGYVVYATGTGFLQFLLAEITVGVGASLLSGTVEAVTYDTLLELGKERTYRKISGNQAFLEFNTESVSSLIGGFVATIGLTLPLWMTIAPMAAAVLVACTLHEPIRHKTFDERHWRAIWNTTTHTLLRHKGLRSITLLHGLISTMTLTFFWFFQPYQKLVGVPLVLFGITHAVIVAAGACAAKSVSSLEKRVDDRLLLMAIALAVVGCYLVLSLPPAMWGLLAFLISRIAWGFLGPLTADMMNRMTTSDVRATVLSVRSFPGRVLFACTSPFVGALADARSIPFALLIAGMIGGTALIVIFVMMRPVWREIPA
ncbi:MFS transporter [Candidatus Peregrinibacteria bacterium]|nr:MFS transporter [Candidatus Peregrinibacteria bacterium]